MEIQTSMLGKINAVPAAKKAVKAVDSNVTSFRNLTNQQKSITGIGSLLAIGVAGFVLYKGYKGISNGFEFITGGTWQKERDKIQVQNQATDQNELMKQKETPTLSVNQAKAIAFGLSEAFRNSQPEWSFNLWDEGTDEAKVYSNLKLIKNYSDWLIVSIHYGSPRKRNLTQELIYELNEKELLKVREILIKANVKI